MHSHLEAVFARLDASRAALRAAVDAVPSDLRRQRPAPDRWSVNEVLEHLSLVEGLFARRIGDAVAAPGAAPVFCSFCARNVSTRLTRLAPSPSPCSAKNFFCPSDLSGCSSR